MIRNTATEHAPWYVVPADNKWFTRLVVSTVVVDTLESLDLRIPRWMRRSARNWRRRRKFLFQKVSDARRSTVRDWPVSSQRS